ATHAAAASMVECSHQREFHAMFFFFFSSRRRHTRFSRDWSSDVCSSDLARQLRLLQLAAVGLSQLAGQMPVSQSLPLFLSLPEQLPSLSKPLIGNFIKQLIIQTDFPLDSSQSRVDHVGRSGGIYAIDAAHRYLAEEGHDYVLVGGVDTYCDPDLLARLDAEDRLMGQGALDGFFPGEGAAFLLLASERVKSQLPSPLIALAKP